MELHQHTILKRFKKLKSKTKDNILGFLKEESVKIQNILTGDDNDLKVETAEQLLEFHIYFKERGYLNRVEESLNNEDCYSIVQLGETLLEQEMGLLLDDSIKGINEILPGTIKKNVEELLEKIWNLNRTINLTFYSDDLDEVEMIIRADIMREELEKKMLYINVLSVFTSDGFISGIYDEEGVIKFFAISVDGGDWKCAPEDKVHMSKIEGAEYIKFEK